jgi:hypothetical protein
MFKPIVNRTYKMEELLQELYNELTEAAHSTNRIYKAAKEPEDYFTHPWKVPQSLRTALGTKRISLEELLKLWIPKWKSEGRLQTNPITLQLSDEEAELFGFPKDKGKAKDKAKAKAQPKKVDIYELFRLMMGLFETPSSPKN